MYRSLVLAALVVPLALGDPTEYSYDYTDAPTMAPTTQTMIPTATNAPTRAETYAPTRMTEAPSYAPTCVKINQCVGVASMAWRSTRRFSTNAP